MYEPSSKDLYSLIDTSVKSRLENKYDKVSLLLSGGLDSSIILHHTLKYCDKVDIVSIENGEKENIQKLQDHYNLEINYIPDNYTDLDLKQAVISYEHSLDYGSLIPNYLLFKNCKNSLVLTGDGADELFSGYSRCLTKDTWNYDVFYELPYYHNIRLDRTSMMFTKEARSPLMSFPLLRYANTLKWKDRRNKKILRELYEGLLPVDIVKGNKKPLRLNNDKQKNKTMVELMHKKHA
jgi:asparagine synthetase B (glutamine-hydrolysing)